MPCLKDAMEAAVVNSEKTTMNSDGLSGDRQSWFNYSLKRSVV